MWLLQDGDTKIYLFGTTHILPPDFAWRSEGVNRVIREAAELVMETADDEASADEGFVDSMYMGKSVPILWRVSPQYRPRLQEIIAASGMPPDFFDELHTWAAGFMLMAIQMQALYGEELEEPMMVGVEDVLTDEFRRAGKPISAVETSNQQMAMFRDMPRRTQQAFLESFLADGPVEESGMTGDEAWVSGRIEFLEREAATMPRDLYELLLIRRNRAWTDWLARRMERPGTVMFAVGALHLTGPDSVQAMLAARGLQARRIE